MKKISIIFGCLLLFPVALIIGPFFLLGLCISNAMDWSTGRSDEDEVM